MGMKFSKEYEAELLARADNIGPSTVGKDIADRLATFTDDLEKGVDIKKKYRVTKVDVPSGPADGEWHKSPVKGIGWGPWTFRIPNWAPTPLNKILYGQHWTAGSKHKKADGEIIAHYGRGVPQAVRKRSVSLHVVFPPGKRMPDVDSFWKSALDSLVACGILVNDSAAWCVMEPVQYSRGQTLVTFITVEDV